MSICKLFGHMHLTADEAQNYKQHTIFYVLAVNFSIYGTFLSPPLGLCVALSSEPTFESTSHSSFSDKICFHKDMEKETLNKPMTNFHSLISVTLR